MSSVQTQALHGVPTWIDLITDDLGSARDFYGPLFGWTFSDLMPSEEGRTSHAYAGHDIVANVTLGPGPSRWRTYFSVDDLEASCAMAQSTGGSVLDIITGHPGRGRWARVRCPGGAEFILWQAAVEHHLRQGIEPGQWSFTALHTGAPNADIEWYSALFGWHVVPADGVTMMGVHGLNSRLVAAGWPSASDRLHVPPEYVDQVAWVNALAGLRRWAPAFNVADRNEAARRAEDLGARVTHSIDFPSSSNAVVEDPHGATFVIVEVTASWPPDSSPRLGHLVAVPSDRDA